MGRDRATRRTRRVSGIDRFGGRASADRRATAVDHRDRLAAAVLRARWLPPVASHLSAGVYFSAANPARPAGPTACRTLAAYARVSAGVRCVSRFIVAPADRH